MEQLLEITIQSGGLILMILICRLLFRNRISARTLYAFWLVPLIRLLIPVSVSSPVSPMNVVLSQAASVQNNTAVYPVPVSQPTVSALTEAAIQQNLTTAQQQSAGISTNAPNAASWDTAGILLIIWLAVAVLLLIYFTVTNVRYIKRLMRHARKITVSAALPENTRVYVSDVAVSPCVFGILRKRIVLTPACLDDARAMDYALRHEAAHIRQYDTALALLRMVVCAVYWFHPLVWVAAKFSHDDCELACDERVTKPLNFNERLEYGHVLVGLVSGRKNDRLRPSVMSAPTTMLGGNSLKCRIQRITNRHQTSRAVTAIIAVLLVMALLVSCTTADENAQHSDAPETGSNSPISTESPSAGTHNSEPASVTQTVSEYAIIVSDYSRYSPSMSSLRGMPFHFSLKDIDSVTVSCDHGMLLTYADGFKTGVKSATLTGDDIANQEDDPRLYWLPMNTAGTLENMGSATVRVDATDNGGNRYHQTLRISLHGIYYWMFDMPDANNAALSSPVTTIYKKDGKSTVLNPTDPYYTEVVEFAVQRIVNLPYAEEAALLMDDDDVAAWKQENDWLELYYPEKYLAGVFVGGDDRRIELMTYSRVLMFTTGEDTNLMFLYNSYTENYSRPIFLDTLQDVPQIPFGQTALGTTELGSVRLTMYAFISSAGDEKYIYTRAEIGNVGSKEVVIDTAPYITVNVTVNGTPTTDYIGEQGTSHTVILQPGETLDVGVTAIRADQSGLYTLSGQFGEYVLPPLEINVD